MHLHTRAHTQVQYMSQVNKTICYSQSAVEILRCYKQNSQTYTASHTYIVWCKLHKKQHVSAFFGKSVLKCHLT